MANAHWRYVTGQMAKLRVPLGVELGGTEPHKGPLAALEARAQTRNTTRPRRAAGPTAELLTSETPAPARRLPPAPRYLASAERAARHLSAATFPLRLARAQRASTGWSRTPVDYPGRPRAQRRQWARLLEQTPALHMDTPEPVRASVHAYTHALAQHARLRPPASRAPRPLPDQGALQVAQHAAQQAALQPQTHKTSITLRISEHAASGRTTRRSARSTASDAEAAWLGGRRS